MKLSSKLQKLKQELKQKKALQDAASRLDGPGAFFAPSTWILLGLLVVLGGLGTWAGFEVFAWNKVPAGLVGLWEVEEGPQKGGTFEFFRDGTMEVHLKSKKGTVTHKTQVSVRDKTLVIVAQGLQGHEELTRDCIIRELTAETLILELEQGDVLKFVRIE
jgi:hypothetical protein